MLQTNRINDLETEKGMAKGGFVYCLSCIETIGLSDSSWKYYPIRRKASGNTGT